MEALIEAGQGVRVEHDDFDGKVEAVESCLVVEPARVRKWSAVVADDCSVGCTETEEAGGEEDENYTTAHGSLFAKVIDGLRVRNENGQKDDWDWDEGQDGEVGACEEADLSQLCKQTLVESEVAVYNAGDEQDETGEEAEVDEDEWHLQLLTPAELGVVSPQNPLGEDDIDDKENNDASVGEDVGSDCDLDIVGKVAPYYPHDKGCDSCHAEAEGGTRDDEFVATLQVCLEKVHVENGACDIERQENCGDWDIRDDRRFAAEHCER